MNKKKFISSFLMTVGALLIVFGGIYAGSAQKDSEEVVEDSDKDSENNGTVEYLKVDQVEGNLRDNKSLYENDDDYSVINMYLDVSRGNDADGSDHTWNEINTYSVYDYNDMGVDRYKVEGILKIDEEGDGIDKNSFGYGTEIPNVSVQVRGQTSSRSADKNYKIRIKDGKGEFRGQRTLDLNKHVGEPYRFVNKLGYDLLETIPQLIAGRTQFVHLYVKDNTRNSDGDASDYEDYGLYTMVEQVNRTFLKNHGLDENGQLYKVTFFEWNGFDEIMIPQDDPEFDQEAFNKYLESKGNPDHSKLQRTIDEIHNYSMPIDKIIEEHFDEENLAYWMAFNILNDNYDVGARNLFLYSPQNSEKFYFICWDMDNSFRYGYNRMKSKHDGESWEAGMTKYLGLTLINRMMKEEKYRNMLEDAVEDVYHNYVSKEIVDERVEEYKKVVKPVLFYGADADNSKISDEAVYDELTSTLGDEVDIAYDMFLHSMKTPWPFYVDVPMLDEENRHTILSWNNSYDYNNEDITYDFVLARDYLFEDVIDEGHDLKSPLVNTKYLSPGTYFLRVSATNESGYTMECFDYFSARDQGKVYGCFCFIVNADGTVNAYEKELK